MNKKSMFNAMLNKVNGGGATCLIALAMSALTACENEVSNEPDAKDVTFVFINDCSDQWQITRGLEADGKAMTDIWILDYMDGNLVQQVHQDDNTADDFGKPTITLSFGSHHLYFIVTRGVDAILNIMMNVCDGMVVYEKVIRQRVMRELPFMATENIMMDAVEKGGNRQELHEKLRVHAQLAARHVKEEGGENDMIERVAADPSFQLNEEDLRAVLKPENYTGRSAEQVTEYLDEIIRPLLKETAGEAGGQVELTV